jgi:recombination protein RecA
MSSIPLFSIAEGSSILPTQAKPPGVERMFASPKLAHVTPASRLAVRSMPERVASGVDALDALTGGWPRGCLSEICGPASSGRSSLLLAALAAATQRQEICALVDANDRFDPESAAAAGMDFERLLWVRCDTREKTPRRRGNMEKITANANSNANTNAKAPAVEQALRVTDLLLQGGGFGMVVVDLASVEFPTVRRIPLASWFRYQRTVEPTSTVLLVVTPAPCAHSCAAVVIKLSAISRQLSAKKLVPAHTELLSEVAIQAEVLRSRVAKPTQSVRAAFETKASWVG